MLSEYSQFIQLELKDESRVYGWPSIWPSNPEKGHFLMTNATWTKSGTGSDLANIEGLLVNVTDVAYVVIRTPQENQDDKGTAQEAGADKALAPSPELQPAAHVSASANAECSAATIQ